MFVKYARKAFQEKTCQILIFWFIQVKSLMFSKHARKNFLERTFWIWIFWHIGEKPHIGKQMIFKMRRLKEASRDTYSRKTSFFRSLLQKTFRERESVHMLLKFVLLVKFSTNDIQIKVTWINIAEHTQVYKHISKKYILNRDHLIHSDENAHFLMLCKNVGFKKANWPKIFWYISVNDITSFIISEYFRVCQAV